MSAPLSDVPHGVINKVVNIKREFMETEFDLKDGLLRLAPRRRTLKELATRLGMNETSDIIKLSETLKECVKEGLLVEEEGRFSAPKRIGAYLGTLRGNKKGFAFLIREDGGEDLFIPHSALNGAIHGDKVFATIVRGDEAKVISIVNRGVSEIVGTYYKKDRHGFIVPDGNNFTGNFFVAPLRGKKIAGNSKVVANVIFRGNARPEAVIKEVIGKNGERRSDVLGILKSYGFFNTFDERVYKEIDSLKSIKEGVRTDFRDMLTVTIDGDDSKDLDDAISLEKNGDNYDLYVHIADVSHYVRRHSVLDREALKRATSVYFPSSVFPMLPPEISNGICSLNEGEERLTLTARMTVNKSGSVIDRELYESKIINDARMTYKNVEKILSGDKELQKRYEKVTPMIFLMKELADILGKNRQRRGYIDFDTKESKITLDEKGDVINIEPYPYLSSNGIIEEFMLLANETVAEFMSNLEYPFIYRVHEKPDSDKIRDFSKFAEGCGLTLNVREIHSGVLQKLLKEVEGRPIEPIISKVMLRSMKKARYTTENLGHFGLATDNYCHFTSPIRRYPDLMIHRIIKMMLNGKLDENAVEKLNSELPEIAEKSSERERSAENAERDIDDYYKTLYMEDKIGNKYEGTVSGVTGFAIFVELDNTVEGAIRLENLPEDRYVFEEDKYRVTGAEHSYALGDRVKITVASTDLTTRRVNFEIDEENA